MEGTEIGRKRRLTELQDQSNFSDGGDGKRRKEEFSEKMHNYRCFLEETFNNTDNVGIIISVDEENIIDKTIFEAQNLEENADPCITDHNIVTPANNTQLDEHDSFEIKIEPHEVIEEPPVTDLFELLKQNLEYLPPNKYWTAIFIPGRNVVVFHRWDKTSSTYSSFMKVVILSDMSYKIFLGKAEVEAQDQPSTAISSLEDVENLLKKVNNIRECLGMKKMRASDECQGFVPSTNTSPKEVLAGYCLPCKLYQLEYNRKSKKVGAPTVKYESIKRKVWKLKTKLRKT